MLQMRGVRRPPSNPSAPSLQVPWTFVSWRASPPPPAPGASAGSRWRGGVARPLPLPPRTPPPSLKGSGGVLPPPSFLVCAQAPKLGLGGEAQGAGGVSWSVSWWWRVGGKKG